MKRLINIERLFKKFSSSFEGSPTKNGFMRLLQAYFRFLFHLGRVGTGCSLLLLASCQLNGDLDELTTIYYETTFEWFYYAGNSSDLYTVKIIQFDNTTPIDTINFDTLTVNKSVKQIFHFENIPEGATTHLILQQITDNITDETVVDTVVNLNGAQTFQFLKLTENSIPVLYGGYDTSGEVVPDSSNQTKFNYYYSEPDLPDSVRLVIYLVENRTFVEPADTLIVYKEEFSGYVLVKQGIHMFQLEDPATGNIIMKVKDVSTIPDMITDFSSQKGYSDAMSSTGYKFATAILYKYSNTKYKDKILFSKDW